MWWLSGDMVALRGCGGSKGIWWLFRGCGGSLGDVVALRGCGGSMVVHQTVKHAVPSSNPASLQHAGTCHSLLGSQQGWHETAGWPLRGGRGKKIQKYKKNNKKKKILYHSP